MFSQTVLDHFHNPRNVGPLEGFTHRGVAGSPGDGPYMVLSFRVTDGNIEQAAYETHGCPAAVAAGSLVCEVLTGKTVQVASLLEPQDVIRLLGGLPEGKEYCTDLAITAIRSAFGG